MRNFLAELRRRSVFKAAVLYVVGAWLIIQIVATVFPALHLPDWTITLVVALQIIGFPIVLVLAWVFDITPEGLRRTDGSETSELAASERGRRMDQFIAALLVVAIGLLLYRLCTDQPGQEPGAANQAAQQTLPGQPVTAQAAQQTLPGQPVTAAPAAPDSQAKPSVPDDGRRSVAVLPFVNMSDDPANEFFCDGISEELLNVLAAFPALRVPSRTSSFVFKGQKVDVAEIGRQLEVEYAVEGSVRKSGDRVRVTAQLIEIGSDTHLWSQTFERNLQDIFAVQDEIARSVAEVLRVKLGVREGAPLVAVKTNNMDAYEYYLRGRQVWRLRRREAVQMAKDLLHRAVELDQDFAHAWADLAVVYLVESSHGDTAAMDDERQAEMAATQALRLDRNMARPQAVMAAIAAGKRQYGESEHLFKMALESEPDDANIHLWYATLLSGLGRLSEAAVEYERAVSLDPSAPVGLTWMAAHKAQGGDFESSLELSLRAVDLGYEPAHWAAFESLVRLGQLDKAEEQLRLAAARNGFDAKFVPELMGELRSPAQGKDPGAALDASLSLPDRMRVYALLGMSQPHLERLLELEGTLFYLSLPVLWDQAAADLREGPEFARLANQLQLPGYWNSSGRWPDSCRPSAEGVECGVSQEAHP